MAVTALGPARLPRPPRWPPLALGLAALGVAWLGPLPELAGQSFAAHMTMHVTVVAVAAPLLALGVAGSRLDPAVRIPALFAAVPASLAELIVIWAWHAPAAHHAARSGPGMLALEQASFLAVGLLVWIAALGGRPTPARAAAGIGALLLTSMHMTLLGVLLAGADRMLYGHHVATHTPLGLPALQDQQLGGVLMLAVGGSTYLAGALFLLAGLLRERRGVAGA